VEKTRRVEHAKLLKEGNNILTYFDCYINNGFSEGINSKIQALKATARGFRNFQNYRTRILFFCGKLTLSPSKSTKSRISGISGGFMALQGRSSGIG
jgi:hypothetical protein